LARSLLCPPGLSANHEHFRWSTDVLRLGGPHRCLWLPLAGTIPVYSKSTGSQMPTRSIATRCRLR